LRGATCKYCMKNKKSNTEEFVKKAIKIHGNRFIYDWVEYKNNIKKVKIFCKRCKEYFMQSPADHLSGYGCGGCVESKGERIIEHILKRSKLIFERQKSFNDCKNPETKRKMKFDFYVLSNNCLIEYDGQFHYKPHPKITKGKQQKDLQNVKYRDEIKNKYAKNNNIKLIRIPYWEFNNIEKILMKELELEKNNEY